MGKIKKEKDYLDMNEMFYEKNNIDKILTTRDDGLGFLTIPVVPIKFEEEIKNINDEIDKLKGKLLEIRSDKAKKELKDKIKKLSAKRIKYFVPLTFYNVKDNILLMEWDKTLFVDLDYDPDYGIKGTGVKSKRKALII
ncbi:MAG TPA: hypothetical protein ENG63_09800 [Candidatus Desulfofervidus auxilii]|uniref:Uncharacterized protein n=1 Tax=Desulfofervidus auxilii TaxID=1621989 RepID=A0A7C0U3W1_DESA2|nr:hypothetical protein [Candidatus Desulfofervidus auxilii]